MNQNQRPPHDGNAVITEESDERAQALGGEVSA
jgi:hypothetical protein